MSMLTLFSSAIAILSLINNSDISIEINSVDVDSEMFDLDSRCIIFSFFLCVFEQQSVIDFN